MGKKISHKLNQFILRVAWVDLESEQAQLNMGMGPLKLKWSHFWILLETEREKAEFSRNKSFSFQKDLLLQIKNF